MIYMLTVDSINHYNLTCYCRLLTIYSILIPCLFFISIKVIFFNLVCFINIFWIHFDISGMGLFLQFGGDYTLSWAFRLCNWVCLCSSSYFTFPLLLYSFTCSLNSLIFLIQAACIFHWAYRYTFVYWLFYHMLFVFVFEEYKFWTFSFWMNYWET